MSIPIKPLEGKATVEEQAEATAQPLERTYVRPEPQDLLREASELPDDADVRGILDPYRDVVTTLLEKNYSARKIAAFFCKRGVQVSASSVRYFLKKKLVDDDAGEGS